jgi:hypothetical protein
MTDPITVGMVVKGLLLLGSLGLVFGVIVYILAIMADAFKH